MYFVNDYGHLRFRDGQKHSVIGKNELSDREQRLFIRFVDYVGSSMYVEVQHLLDVAENL